MNPYDIVALGDVNIDYVLADNLSFPLSELVHNGMIYWEDINEIPGGSGLNFCSFATQKGYRCLMLGRVGDDLPGQMVTHWLHNKGIDTSTPWMVSQPTGKAFIMRDSMDIRLLINNKDNANHSLSLADITRNRDALTSCKVIYVSGYCVSEPLTPRFEAAVNAMSLAKTIIPQPTIVFDTVPHRIYEKFTFDEFRKVTENVDILISEVATMRRFLGLGTAKEKISHEIAEETANQLIAFYPRLLLRFGDSGCDEELLVDQPLGFFTFKETGHATAVDKRGYGDDLAVRALRDFFRVLPKKDQIQ